MFVRRSRTFALSRLDHVVVGLDAHEIVSLEGDDEPSPFEHLDIAALIGVRVRDDAPRRFARVRGLTPSLLLGSSVHLADYDPESCFPLPRFVAPALRRRGIDGLLLLPDGLAYILAMDLLSASTARKEEP